MKTGYIVLNTVGVMVVGMLIVRLIWGRAGSIALRIARRLHLASIWLQAAAEGLRHAHTVRADLILRHSFNVDVLDGVECPQREMPTLFGGSRTKDIDPYSVPVGWR